MATLKGQRTCPHCLKIINDFAEYQFRVCPPCRLELALLAELTLNQRVLDVGSGMAGYHRALVARLNTELWLLDAHPKYHAIHNPPPEVSRLAGKAEEVLPMFSDGAFDVALALDVPEHLAPREAVALVAQMKRIARRVIIFVPEGEHPQDHDQLGHGADYWQTHRSTWRLASDNGALLVAPPKGTHPTHTVKLGQGWRAERWEDFHAHLAPAVEPGALFAVWSNER